MGGMDLIGDRMWSNYQKLMSEDIPETFMGVTVEWLRIIGETDLDGEDSPQRATTIELKALMDYNDYRTWRINQSTDSGEVERQSVVVFLSVKSLKDNGYWFEGKDGVSGTFDYDVALDRFKLDGITWKSTGDTPVSQAKDRSLFFQLVLEREEIPNPHRR